jgi:hypothetical protein
LNVFLAEEDVAVVLDRLQHSFMVGGVHTIDGEASGNTYIYGSHVIVLSHLKNPLVFGVCYLIGIFVPTFTAPAALVVVL